MPEQQLSQYEGAEILQMYVTQYILIYFTQVYKYVDPCWLPTTTHRNFVQLQLNGI